MTRILVRSRNSKHVESMGYRADPDERQEMGKAAGIHHRFGQSGIASSERVSDPQRSSLAELAGDLAARLWRK
jgi:hypothetical protein